MLKYYPDTLLKVLLIPFFVDFKEKQFRVLAEPPVVAVALQNTFSLGAEAVVADLVVRAIGGEGIGVGVDKAGTAGKQQCARQGLNVR